MIAFSFKSSKSSSVHTSYPFISSPSVSLISIYYHGSFHFRPWFHPSHQYPSALHSLPACSYSAPFIPNLHSSLHLFMLHGYLSYYQSFLCFTLRTILFILLSSVGSSVVLIGGSVAWPLHRSSCGNSLSAHPSGLILHYM